MKPKISIITLAVVDLARALVFYRDGLGLATQGITDDHILCSEIAKIAKQKVETPSSAECILGYTAETSEEVDAILLRAVAAGATLPDRAEKQPWGGYLGHFIDPDGHIWEVMC